MKAALDIKDLTVNYGGISAISNISAEIPFEQVTAIIGPNGSGKTTLIKAVLELLPRQKGIIKVMGQPFARVRNHVAYVPQKEEVDWHYPLLVWEAVAMGRLKPENILRALGNNDVEIVEESLARMGLTELANRPIGQLSGGQKQRVFLARALARRADLYLLDEPFNGVDATTEKIIMEYIQALRKQGKTIIIVHHKLNEVYSSFDLTLLLNRELIAFGPTPEVFKNGFIQEAYREKLQQNSEERVEKGEKCLAY